MSAILHIYDEMPGSKRTLAGTVTLSSERTTVREIIRRRVEEEVKEYNRWKEGVFQGLVQPVQSERVVNGDMVHYELAEGLAIDAEEQIRVALESFEAKRYHMLFDDRQVEQLEDEVTLTGNNAATFVKMTALVGG